MKKILTLSLAFLLLFVFAFAVGVTTSTNVYADLCGCATCCGYPCPPPSREYWLGHVDCATMDCIWWLDGCNPAKCPHFVPDGC